MYATIARQRAGPGRPAGGPSQRPKHGLSSHFSGRPGLKSSSVLASHVGPAVRREGNGGVVVASRAGAGGEGAALAERGGRRWRRSTPDPARREGYGEEVLVGVADEAGAVEDGGDVGPTGVGVAAAEREPVDGVRDLARWWLLRRASRTRRRSWGAWRRAAGSVPADLPHGVAGFQRRGGEDEEEGRGGSGRTRRRRPRVARGGRAVGARRRQRF